MSENKITRPVVKKPVVRKPVVAKPVVKKPVVAKPVINEQASEEVVKPKVNRPVVSKPVVKKPVVAKPTITQEEIDIETEQEELIEEEVIMEDPAEVIIEDEFDGVLTEEDEMVEVIEEEPVVTKPVVQSKPKVASKPKPSKPISRKKPETTVIGINTKEHITYETLIPKILEKKTPFIKREELLALLRQNIKDELNVEITLKHVTGIIKLFEDLVLDMAEKNIDLTFLGATVKRAEVPTRLWKPNAASKDKHVISNVAKEHYQIKFSKDVNKPTPEENLRGDFDPTTNIFTTDDGDQYELDLAKSIIKNIWDVE